MNKITQDPKPVNGSNADHLKNETKRPQMPKRNEEGIFWCELVFLFCIWPFLMHEIEERGPKFLFIVFSIGFVVQFWRNQREPRSIRWMAGFGGGFIGLMAVGALSYVARMFSGGGEYDSDLPGGMRW